MNEKQDVGLWKVSIRKNGSTWDWFTMYPQGGGYGSSYCGPKHIALARATANIPVGEPYLLDGARFIKRSLERRDPATGMTAFETACPMD